MFDGFTGEGIECLDVLEAWEAEFDHLRVALLASQPETLGSTGVLAAVLPFDVLHVVQSQLWTYFCAGGRLQQPTWRSISDFSCWQEGGPA